MQDLKFEVIKEAVPGEKFRRLFDNNWPAYRAWYLDEGESARPTYLECVDAVKHYMPELFPIYKQILKLVDADDLQARYLSLYQPPPFYSGCSQLIAFREQTALVRNYDFPPILCEGTVLHTQWLDKQVITMADGVWGVLDGMNDAGLALSIAYGGHKLQGDGFAVTIVLRYILETCNTVNEAIAVLRRIPIHLDYNIALLDQTGAHATVFVAPGQDISVGQVTTSTNQRGPVSGDTALFLEDSQIRLDALNALSARSDLSAQETALCFLQPPLYRPHQLYPSGTLYTAAYFPATGQVQYLWPHQNLVLSFDQFSEQECHIHYSI
ncbi:hypothetical protein HBA55_00820 [Pseudomaricurvus alkylphenolicus]|jgi:predicted choloylglycine hydrolase|uniref:C45 family autoproteolytic acyltransferase/hydolase n=1 Tax=Pseudomaricurvus alkylphenolicus TaxID=1306991 RepID=UPI0014242985|nr:C45 family peptidase [Pseudomaricurvus alkylphenolicus]NIB38103.1 hypothetical protein [Pseudomaricurvus alkylphenolicus]